MTHYHDYLVILRPPENIVNRIGVLKDSSAAIIGDYRGLHSKAQITVQSWPRKKPVWIEPLLPKLERDLQALPPLALDINGFDFFDQQEHLTIYARVNSTPLTKIWFKLLGKFFSTPPFEPYITIAHNIPYQDFKKLWPHFKTRQWEQHFTADKLTILRRETIGYDKSYKIFKEIPFNQKLDFNAFTTAKLKTPVVAITKINTQQVSLF